MPTANSGYIHLLIFSIFFSIYLNIIFQEELGIIPLSPKSLMFFIHPLSLDFCIFYSTYCGFITVSA